MRLKAFIGRSLGPAGEWEWTTASRSLVNAFSTVLGYVFCVAGHASHLESTSASYVLLLRWFLGFWTSTKRYRQG